MAPDRPNHYYGLNLWVCVITQVIPLSDARAQLAGLMQAAEAGQVVHISRHGKPVAVLLSEHA